VLHTPVTCAPKALGDLHGERPNASRRAYDQDALPRLDLPDVADALKRRAPSGGHRRRLLKAEVRGLRRDLVGPRRRVLGERPVADAEHLVARAERGGPVADGLDLARDVLTTDPLLGFPQPGDEPYRVRRAGHDVPVADERARCDDADQDLPATRDRRLDVLQPKDVGRAILVLDDCLHAFHLLNASGLRSRRLAVELNVSQANACARCGRRRQDTWKSVCRSEP